MENALHSRNRARCHRRRNRKAPAPRRRRSPQPLKRPRRGSPTTVFLNRDQRHFLDPPPQQFGRYRRIETAPIRFEPGLLAERLAYGRAGVPGGPRLDPQPPGVVRDDQGEIRPRLILATPPGNALHERPRPDVTGPPIERGQLSAPAKRRAMHAPLAADRAWRNRLERRELDTAPGLAPHILPPDRGCPRAGNREQICAGTDAKRVQNRRLPRTVVPHQQRELAMKLEGSGFRIS